MTLPDASTVYVVLVNWNGKDVTLECLHSLDAVSYRNVRIIVVDNASTDGSAAAFRSRFPECHVLEMKVNLRFAGGTNAGLNYALAEGAQLFLLLNNDTTVASDFLTAMVARLQSDARVGMVAPKIYYDSDPTTIWFAGGAISMWTGTMKHTGIREIDTGQYNLVREIDYATGCCILTKREVLEKVGLLDEAFHMYGEDADWSERAKRAGYRIVYEPTAHVWHKLSGSVGGHMSIFKMRNKLIGNFRFFSRFARWYHWLVFPWMSILVNAFAAVKYLLTARR